MMEHPAPDLINYRYSNALRNNATGEHKYFYIARYIYERISLS